MGRMPWRNESRICRWPDGWGGYSGPTKEEKLRKKHPELQKAWKKYKRCSDIYDNTTAQGFAKPAATSVNKKKWNTVLKNFKKAKKDYEFLKKILWDY